MRVCALVGGGSGRWSKQASISLGWMQLPDASDCPRPAALGAHPTATLQVVALMSPSLHVPSQDSGDITGVLKRGNSGV
jgi:hypothetical protein